MDTVAEKKRNKCGLGGAKPTGGPCEDYEDGKCTSTTRCEFAIREAMVTKAEVAERVKTPERIRELLEHIAGGNFKLDSEFLNSDTYRILHEAAVITDYYTPTSERWHEERLDEVNTVETDGLKLAGLNTTLGQVLGVLQSQVEDLKSYIKELEARKELQVEQSLRSGLRLGNVSDRRVKAIVRQDSQVVEAEEMLSVARRRSMIVKTTCDRIESTVNMLKIRARGLRRDV
jgi:hypothetical protein